MKLNRIFWTLLLAGGAVSAQAQDPYNSLEQIEALRQKALEIVAPIPDVMPGAEQDTPALVSLGRKLYFDPILSENKTQSCNTCHNVNDGMAGVDNEPTSPGAFGKRGGRNSPTTLNAGFHVAQFWDGRSPDLVDQAKGPVMNPIEMGMPDEATVEKRLMESPGYPEAFNKAFPGQDRPVNYQNMAEAIAAFERTLITHDRFDDFLKGQSGALTSLELKGLDTFMNVGCTTCHHGALLGGNNYQKMGLVYPYENQEDPGLFDITGEEADRMKFKVPSLRNIAATHPYFHDGQVRSLEQAVREMARMQLGLELNQEQERSLVAFLESLTGKGIRVEPVQATEKQSTVSGGS